VVNQFQYWLSYLRIGIVKGSIYWNTVFNETPSQCPRVLKGRQLVAAYLKKDEKVTLAILPQES
jgi:hypothetical protein